MQPLWPIPLFLTFSAVILSSLPTYLTNQPPMILFKFLSKPLIRNFRSHQSHGHIAMVKTLSCVSCKAQAHNWVHDILCLRTSLSINLPYLNLLRFLFNNLHPARLHTNSSWNSFCGEAKDPSLTWTEVSERTSTAGDSRSQLLCLPLSTAADKTSSLLPQFSQQEGHRTARHAAGKGGQGERNRSGIWRPQLFHGCNCKCHATSRGGAEARTLDHGSATVWGMSLTRLSFSKL